MAVPARILKTDECMKSFIFGQTRKSHAHDAAILPNVNVPLVQIELDGDDVARRVGVQLCNRALVITHPVVRAVDPHSRRIVHAERFDIVLEWERDDTYRDGSQLSSATVEILDVPKVNASFHPRL